MERSLSGSSVYLNNAATTWPKPPCVGEAMAHFLSCGEANLGRGTSSSRDMGTLNAVLARPHRRAPGGVRAPRPEIGRHTSELQSLYDLVCRLLLEKKK